MTLDHCFKVCSFILIVILSVGFGSYPLPAFAQREPVFFIVDINSKDWIQLGSLDDLTYPTDINNAGQVVGFRSTDADEFHAFITGPNGNGMTAIETIDGGSSNASAINDSGQVAGTFQTATGAHHAYITGQNGVGMIDLGTLGGTDSFGQHLNEAGQVVGLSETPTGEHHAYITGPNGIRMTDLGALGGTYSSAEGINDAGQVVGFFNAAEGYHHHAFITGPNGIEMTDMGIGSKYYSEAFDINNASQVVGTSDGIAFIASPKGGGMTDIHTFGQYGGAHDINDAGQGVYQQYVFVTGPDGEEMVNLNSLVDMPDGIILGNAIAINDKGQVLVRGFVDTNTPAIAEPQTFAMLLAGLGLIGFMVRHKKEENTVKR